MLAECVYRGVVQERKVRRIVDVAKPVNIAGTHSERVLVRWALSVQRIRRLRERTFGMALGGQLGDGHPRREGKLLKNFKLGNALGAAVLDDHERRRAHSKLRLRPLHKDLRKEGLIGAAAMRASAHLVAHVKAADTDTRQPRRHGHVRVVRDAVRHDPQAVRADDSRLWNNHQ